MASGGMFILSHREFSLRPVQATRTHDLVHRIPGLTMVFFYGKSCEHCDVLKPIFMSLQGRVPGVHFAMANVSADDMQLQKMSEASITPIRYVPFLAVYVNGTFYMEYRGPKTAESIARAVVEISAKLESGKDFVTGRVCQAPSGQPGYCAEGGDENDVCYFSFDEAYNGKPVSNENKGSFVTFEEAYGGARI